MKKEQFAFLFGGFAFGVLVGFALFVAYAKQPDLEEAGPATSQVPSVAGPQAPGAPPMGGGTQGAPVMARVNELKAQIQQEPEAIDAMLELGSLYSQVQMWDQASSWYERAAEARPDDAGLIVRLANTFHDAAMQYQNTGRTDQALEMWNRALRWYERANELRPGDPDLLTDTGVAYRGLQRYGEALDYFKRAQEADNGHFQSLFNMVVVAGFDLREFEIANAALDRLEQLQVDDPGFGQQLVRLRQAYEQRRQESEAGS